MRTCFLSMPRDKSSRGTIRCYYWAMRTARDRCSSESSAFICRPFPVIYTPWDKRSISKKCTTYRIDCLACRNRQKSQHCAQYTSPPILGVLEGVLFHLYFAFEMSTKDEASNLPFCCALLAAVVPIVLKQKAQARWNPARMLHLLSISVRSFVSFFPLSCPLH